MSTPKVLLVEDDSSLGFVIQDQLTQNGFDVVKANNGEEGWKKYESMAFDICVVDVMMPEMDGFTLAQKIRTRDGITPIVFLTAKSLAEDRLKGFEIGGDDYVTKPFSMQELVYRLKVFLKRKGEISNHSSPINIGALRFDKINLSLLGLRQSVRLTQREADVLDILIQQKNQLVKRDVLLVELWGEDDYFKGRSLDVFISRLRKYLKMDPELEIRNHHGVGFTLLDHHFPG